jgi:mevalonate kinase
MLCRFDVLNASREVPISEDAKRILAEFCETRQDFKNCEEGLLPAQRAAFQSFLFLYLAIFDEVTPYCFLVETELPVGAGLGSSASFAVALAGGLLIGAKKEKVKGFNMDTVRAN